MSRKKFTDASEIGRMGGLKIKEMKGTAYFAELGAKGRASIRKNDPDFYKRLSLSGIHSREVKKQAWIKDNLMDTSSPTDKLTKILIGG